MKNNIIEVIVRKTNLIFAILTSFFFINVKHYLDKAGYSQIGRSADYEEAFTAFSLIIWMAVSLYLYSRKKTYSNLFNVSYMAVVCLVVLIIFLPIGYSKYIIEYSVVGSWIYYIFLCVIFIAWNLAQVVRSSTSSKKK